MTLVNKHTLKLANDSLDLEFKKTALILEEALKKAEQEKKMSPEAIKESKNQINEGLNRIKLLWQKKLTK